MEQAITALGEDGFAAVYVGQRRHRRRRDRGAEGGRDRPGDRPMTGQDAELAAIQRIIDGEQFMTVYKPIKTLADSAAEIAVALANGEEVPSGLINGKEDNGTEQVPTVFLDTIPVTADNIQDSIIADDFWSVDEICTQQYAQACKNAGIQ